MMVTSRLIVKSLAAGQCWMPFWTIALLGSTSIGLAHSASPNQAFQNSWRGLKPSLDEIYLANSNERLETPTVVKQHIFEGPSIDLVAINRRRFEQDHQHASQVSSEQELAKSELIESKIAAIPERILSQLPEETTKQLAESFSTDPSLIMGPAAMALAESGGSTGAASEDPDGASIERLTKSCLMIQASSNRLEQLNVTFQLYTKNNPVTPHIIWPHTSRLELIKSSPFDPSKPIKWITHGFHTNVDKSEWMLETKNKILAYEEANVILTDWRRGASPALAFYPTAAANAHVVAKIIVKLLRRLRDDIDLSKVHLIGHSLGAHIMGFVGSAFTEEHLHNQQQVLAALQTRAEARGEHRKWSLKATAEKMIDARQLIGRITACDPALPCFGPTSSAPNNRLSRQQQLQMQHQQHLQQISDGHVSGGQEMLADDWTPTMWTHLRPDSAIVVEVMHSNPGVMGYSDPLGDFDLYPNGLERQPGCGVGGPPLLGSQPDLGSLLRTSQEQPVSKQPSWLFRPQRLANSATDFLKSMLPSPMVSRGSSMMQSPRASSSPSQFDSGNGEHQQLRLSNTLDKLIKPIRDFFNGYTCSHHRSVEYMVESMYYEEVPQDRRLDRDLVCQMVGYRCPDYLSFKKGFCFRCRNQLECRSFTLGVTANRFPTLASGRRMQPQRSRRQGPEVAIVGPQTNSESLTKFTTRLLVELSTIDSKETVKPDNDTLLHEDVTQIDSLTNATAKPTMKKLISQASERLNSTKNFLKKRVLPSFDHRELEYLPESRNLYYFDTRPSKSFCLHHYHLFVKYRWFRVRPSLAVEGLKIVGTLANITQHVPITFNMFTYQTYTMLLTESVFLGQVESLIIWGGQLKPTLVEYIEITYMSNLDPRIRALGSARLCRQPDQQARYRNKTFPISADGDPFESHEATRFGRCSGSMV